MPDTPLVSIIIPIYKVEKYLEQCIESVVNQTYKKTEIILVDDGSPDNSGAIAEKWAQKDKRISTIHRKNGGLSAARNTGLDHSHGDWIAFVDSDDYISPRYVEAMLEAAQRDKTKLVISHYLEIDEKNGVVAEIQHNTPGIYDEISFWKYLYSKTGNNVPLGVAWSKLYNRTIFKTLRFKEGIIHEDDEILYDVIHLAQRVSVIADDLYYYRINRSGSIMSDIANKNLIDTLTYKIDLCRVRKMIKSNQFDVATLCNATLGLNILAGYSNNLTVDDKEKLNKFFNRYKANVRYLSAQGYKAKLDFKDKLILTLPNIYLFLKSLKRKL